MTGAAHAYLTALACYAGLATLRMRVSCDTGVSEAKWNELRHP